MGTKSTLAKSIQVVGTLLAAFGGFLVGVAPPEEADARFAIGVSSFSALILLLFISALSRQWPQNRFRVRWLGAAGVLFIVCVVVAIQYKDSYDLLAFAYPEGNKKVEFVAGMVMTQEAQQYVATARLKPTNAQLLAKFGGPGAKELVWTADSLRAARHRLIALYVALVVSLASTIFALTEGTLVPIR